MAPKKNLIITADDFGCCNYIDKGIIKGINHGVVTCVSAFINFEKRDKDGRGGAYDGSLKAITKLMNKKQKNNLSFPVGLHLTINAGRPVLPIGEVPDLIRPKSRKFHGYFKDILDFDPKLYLSKKKKVREQVIAEIRAQLKLYKFNFGEPNHISCHYGILFHFKHIFEEYVKINGIEKYPLRNPFLVYQTPKDDKDAAAIKLMKKYHRTKSKMKIEGISKGAAWLIKYKGLIKAFRESSPEVRLKLMNENKIVFPDYSLDYMYKRASDFKSLEKPFSFLTREVAECYKHKNRKPNAAVYELFAHLGDGVPPKEGPVGVSKKYFPSRMVELNRLIANKKWLNAGDINLVDFSILKK